MQPAPGHAGRRPRKRPPWQSYVPFYSACAGCVLILALLAFGATRLRGGGGHSAASVPAPTATISRIAPPAPSVAPTSTSDVQMSTLPHADATPDTTLGATLGPHPATVGSPRPRAAPATATVPAAASLVVARELDKSGRPRKVARRFVSPALYLYAVATVRQVHRADVLRFVFERDGKRMPNNDVTFTAKVDAAAHRFAAFADANDQETSPLPHGRYRVLFYRNGRLEAVTAFRVG